MSEREALIALRDAVVAGRWGSQTQALRSPPSTFKTPFASEPMDKRRRQAWSAYHGSVDAAIALLEAVLPGWGWGKLYDGSAYVSEIGPAIEYIEAKSTSAARALLIATLNALIAETD